MSGTRNLRQLLRLADRLDRESGAVAYRSYHQVIGDFAEHYEQPFDRALAAFAALSPNSDYFGNLRSLASVLDGYRQGVPRDHITVSTYKHCRDRALAYLSGEACFLSTVRGLKIRAFYLNILNPDDPRPVTIDGHMVCAWRGVDAPMKQSLVRPREYEQVASGFRRLARTEGLLPNQLQATLWLTRKRVLRIKFDGQLDLFAAGVNPSGLMVSPREALPYAMAVA